MAARGRRARRGPLLVHLLIRPGSAEPARAGVVVGKRVGNAVCRNLVKRRLRAHLRERLPQLDPGTLVVVRALPQSGTASYAELGRALDAALPGSRVEVSV